MNENTAPIESRPMTAGEKAVGLTFNPSKDKRVQEVKEKSAFLIDYFLQLQNEATDPAAKRQFALAITYIEDSCMRAVKGITWNY